MTETSKVAGLTFAIPRGGARFDAATRGKLAVRLSLLKQGLLGFSLLRIYFNFND